MGIRELPQKPFVVVGADYQQVAPIGGGTRGQKICSQIQTIELIVVHRDDDPKLLICLKLSRVKQPTRTTIRKFFGDRLLKLSLEAAVKFGLALQQQTGKLFLCGCASLIRARGTLI